MTTRNTLRTALSLFAITGLLASASHVEARSKVQRPRVEVVFALDTTSSMGGLIGAAKTKIWSIVNEIAEGKPSPDIKLGLVGFRDKGDAYVTTKIDLTGDLDAVYEKLMAFQPQGGGDGPEHVNAALKEAVHGMSWSQDRKTLKVVYLVGDAPPHMDYAGEVEYPKLAKQAIRKDLIINTVQCGSWGETTKIFKDIAYRSEGRFLAIAQSGGAVAVTTPFDSKLAELSRKLDSTYLTYGKVAEQRARKAKLKRADTLSKSAAPEAAAARASFRGSAGAGAFGGGRDLIADAETGKVVLGELDDDELPVEMQGLDKKAQTKLLAEKKVERKKIQKQIAKLSKQRDAHVKMELAKKGGAKDSFDAKVMDSLREAAADKGIKY